MAASGKSKKKMSLNRRNTLVGLSFILPNFIGFFIFVMIPVVFSLMLSFADWDGFNPMKFAGLDNFIAIFKDRVFRGSIWKTLYFSVFTVFFSMCASLGLAILLNQKLKGKGIFRCAIFFLMWHPPLRWPRYGISCSVTSARLIPFCGHWE